MDKAIDKSDIEKTQLQIMAKIKYTIDKKKNYNFRIKYIYYQNLKQMKSLYEYEYRVWYSRRHNYIISIKQELLSSVAVCSSLILFAAFCHHYHTNNY